MKTHFAKILPILLALSLLIGLIPLAGLMASAEVQAPPDGFTVVNADGKDHEIDAQNHNEWQPANGDVDLSGAAKNARLGFYFDTTAIAYDATQGDKNNYAFYIDVWVKGGSGWKSIAFSDDKMERVFTRDGKETTVTGHIKGEEQSYFCLPVNATGYIYISLGDDVDTSSVVALKLSPCTIGARICPVRPSRRATSAFSARRHRVSRAIRSHRRKRNSRRTTPCTAPRAATIPSTGTAATPAT